MRIILGICLSILFVGLSSCNSEPNNLSSETYYIDTEFLLVNKVRFSSSDNDIMEFTIRTLDKPYMYRVLSSNTSSCRCGIRVDSRLYNKYDLGDKLYYKYLLKEPFFSKNVDIILDEEKSELDEYFNNY